MNIEIFRAALRTLGDKHWPGREVGSAPLVKIPFSLSLTDDFAAAGARDFEGISRIIARPYLWMGSEPISMTGAGEAGCSYRLPFPEVIFHVHVPASERNRTDAIVLAVDTGDAAYPDLVVVGNFWRGIEDVAVVLTRRNALQKHMALWDLNPVCTLSGPRLEQAMDVLARVVDENAGLFDPEQQSMIESLGDAVAVIEMAKLRPILFRITDPARQFVLVEPEVAGRSPAWVEARTYYEVLNEQGIREAQGLGGLTRPAALSWKGKGRRFLVLAEKPDAYEAAYEQESPDVPAFMIGKATADDPDWVFIMTEHEFRHARLSQGPLPSDWCLTFPLQAGKLPPAARVESLVRDAVKLLADLRVLPTGSVASFRIETQPIPEVSTIVIFEGCPGCRARGNLHVAYRPAGMSRDTSDFAVGKAFDAFLPRWQELRPDLMDTH